MLPSVSRGAPSFCGNALVMPPFYVPYLSNKSTLIIELQVYEKSNGHLIMI